MNPAAEPANAALCSVIDAELGVDPVGSAPSFRRLVLVELPLPWPAKIERSPLLEGAADAPTGTRVQGVVPVADRIPAALVTVWRADGRGRFHGSEAVVEPDELDTTLRRLVHDDVLPADAASATSDVLVCGHGARDRCCGSFGTRTHVEVLARGLSARVRRSSHLGGHRYAPTALTMPDGRLWAHLDADLLRCIVERGVDHTEVAGHYRGTPTLPEAAQVLERELFRELGWDWLDHGGVETWAVEDADDATAVVLEWPGGRAEGVIEVARRLPVVVCGDPAAPPTKTSREYRLVTSAIAT